MGTASFSAPEKSGHLIPPGVILPTPTPVAFVDIDTGGSLLAWHVLFWLEGLAYCIRIANPLRRAYQVQGPRSGVEEFLAWRAQVGGMLERVKMPQNFAV